MEITRRKFLELSTATIASSAITAQVSAETVRQHPITDSGWKKREMQRKPNIVVVVLDDVGFADLSCYGSEYHMPCTDALAANGTRLSDVNYFVRFGDNYDGRF